MGKSLKIHIGHGKVRENIFPLLICTLIWINVPFNSIYRTAQQQRRICLGILLGVLHLLIVNG